MSLKNPRNPTYSNPHHKNASQSKYTDQKALSGAESTKSSKDDKLSPESSARKGNGSPSYIKSKMSPYKLILFGKKDKSIKEDTKKKPIKPYSNINASGSKQNMVSDDPSRQGYKYYSQMSSKHAAPTTQINISSTSPNQYRQRKRSVSTKKQEVPNHILSMGKMPQKPTSPNAIQLQKSRTLKSSLDKRVNKKISPVAMPQRQQPKNPSPIRANPQNEQKQPKSRNMAEPKKFTQKFVNSKNITMNLQNITIENLKNKRESSAKKERREPSVEQSYKDFLEDDINNGVEQIKKKERNLSPEQQFELKKEQIQGSYIDTNQIIYEEEQETLLSSSLSVKCPEGIQASNSNPGSFVNPLVSLQQYINKQSVQTGALINDQNNYNRIPEYRIPPSIKQQQIVNSEDPMYGDLNLEMIEMEEIDLKINDRMQKSQFNSLKQSIDELESKIYSESFVSSRKSSKNSSPTRKQSAKQIMKTNTVKLMASKPSSATKKKPMPDKNTLEIKRNPGQERQTQSHKKITKLTSSFVNPTIPTKSIILNIDNKKDKKSQIVDLANLQQMVFEQQESRNNNTKLDETKKRNTTDKAGQQIKNQHGSVTSLLISQEASLQSSLQKQKAQFSQSLLVPGQK